MIHKKLFNLNNKKLTILIQIHILNHKQFTFNKLLKLHNKKLIIIILMEVENELKLNKNKN